MSLLVPDTGLLFWMVLSFGVVVFILARYGFPVITRMVDERKALIDRSLEEARQAHEQLATIQVQSEEMLRQAREEQSRLLTEALETKKQILSDAREAAQRQTRIQLEQARKEIDDMKEKAIREVRSEIAGLSVDIAEKVLRGKLENEKEQKAVIERLLDESVIYKS